jgi:hypothetical protein
LYGEAIFFERTYKFVSNGFSPRKSRILFDDTLEYVINYMSIELSFGM